MAIYNNVNTVSGTIEIGLVETVLGQNDAADTIIIDMFPDFYDFAERFVGYNFVYPGLYRNGTFTIQNNTGISYIVTDYMFQVDSIGFKRTFNGMAQAMGLSLAAVAALSGDEWYRLNIDYYGEENLNDLGTLRRLFGHEMTGPGSAGGYGVNVGVETSSEMIELAKQYLYRQCQFSFNIETFPINGMSLSEEAITLWDYINKTEENRDIVLNQIFSQPIEAEGFSSLIGYTNDYSIGNVCNGAYVDFMFTITLNTISMDVVVLNYDGNSNTGGAVPVDENSYTPGDSATVLGNTGELTREGYIFLGWNTEPDGSGANYNAGDIIVLNSDITLYALWGEQPAPPPIKPCRPRRCICQPALCSCARCRKPFRRNLKHYRPCQMRMNNGCPCRIKYCITSKYHRFLRRK